MTASELLDLCASGEVSPQIALSRLLLTGQPVDADHLAREAARRPDQPALGSLAALADRHRDRLESLSRLARSGLWPEGEDILVATARIFDRLAAEAPEAAVAFYSFGDPDELAAATAELVAVVRAWAPAAARRVLDFGCGIGRVSAALAGEAADVLGVDISAGMVAAATARAQGAGNLRFTQIAGCDMPVGDGAVDLLIAADSLPFVVEANALASFMAETARVLAPRGDLLVFNWSYRGDPGRDIAEAHERAAAVGLEVLRAGERPFKIWDATAFHLRRA